MKFYMHLVITRYFYNFYNGPIGNLAKNICHGQTHMLIQHGCSAVSILTLSKFELKCKISFIWQQSPNRLIISNQLRDPGSNFNRDYQDDFQLIQIIVSNVEKHSEV